MLDFDDQESQTRPSGEPGPQPDTPLAERIRPGALTRSLGAAGERQNLLEVDGFLDD